MGYGGADLSTTYPDPTVVSYGESDTADDISQVSGTVSQWGSTIAGLVTSVQSVTNPQPVTTVVSNSPVSSRMSPGSILFLLAVAVVAVILIAKE